MEDFSVSVFFSALYTRGIPLRPVSPPPSPSVPTCFHSVNPSEIDTVVPCPCTIQRPTSALLSLSNRLESVATCVWERPAWSTVVGGWLISRFSVERFRLSCQFVGESRWKPVARPLDKTWSGYVICCVCNVMSVGLLS